MPLPVLPTINASLNALSALFLFLGWYFIKNHRKDVHMKFMIAALISSTLFLVCYVTYHALKQGVVTKYQGEGIWRWIYFLVLGTHTPLAVVIVPASLRAVYWAVKGNFERHTRITRWLWPAWMYVSLTGVIIYLMLYIF